MADDIGVSGSTGSGLLAPQPDEDSTMRGSARELKDRARESSRDLLDQAVEKKDELKARAGTMVDDGRHRAADRAGTLARALHGTADNLEQEGDRQLSQWVHQAAQQVDRVVGYLEGHDPGGLVRDMEDLARRNPALFLGGTYAAGLVLGRFLRASAPERRGDDGREGTDDVRMARTEERTERSAAEQHWPGSTSSYDDGMRERTGDADSTRTGNALPDGFRTTPSSRSPASFAGESDAGMTDEDLRAAWHDRGGRTDDGMRASSGAEERFLGDRLGTGELTRYTNDERERGV
jgi:hypothetical protein